MSPITRTFVCRCLKFRIRNAVMSEQVNEGNNVPHYVRSCAVA